MKSPAAPLLQRPGPLKGIFYAVVFIFAVIVYVSIYKYLWKFASYPIELEYREGAFWLHALAQSYGADIFEDAKLAYVNAEHGIFDHIVKGAMACALRSWEPQYILRFFVILFPAVSCFAIFVHSRRKMPATAALISALCLNCAMLVTLHDIGHWNTCIGRTDSTAFTLLGLAYLCYSAHASTRQATLLRHISYLAIALVLSTNWKWYPVALTIPAILEQHQNRLRIRELVRIYLLIAGYTLGTCALFAVVWFHGDVSTYYRYFYGFFGPKSPLPPNPGPIQMMIHYVRTPAIAVFILLSVLPVFIEAWRHFLGRSGSWPRILAAIAVLLSMFVMILALKMNFIAGGYWYLSPQAIVLVVYFNDRYKIGPGLAAVILVLGLGILSRSDNLPLMRWYDTQLTETLPAARKYAADLTRLDQAFGVYSEEAHLFRRSKDLAPVDMGDFAEIFAKTTFLAPRYASIFSEQRSRITSHEAVLVFVGPCASSAFKQLAEDEAYVALLRSPAPGMGGVVYVRIDHIEEVQRFLMGHAANSP